MGDKHRPGAGKLLQVYVKSHLAESNLSISVVPEVTPRLSEVALLGRWCSLSLLISPPAEGTAPPDGVVNRFTTG